MKKEIRFSRTAFRNYGSCHCYCPKIPDTKTPHSTQNNYMRKEKYAKLINADQRRVEFNS